MGESVGMSGWGNVEGGMAIESCVGFCCYCFCFLGLCFNQRKVC